MATDKGLTAALKGMPKETAAALAKQLAGSNLTQLGKVRVFTKGTPVPDEWIISVLPPNAGNAKKLIDTLVARPGRASFEVFPYGILDPEIGRIDIRIGAG